MTSYETTLTFSGVCFPKLQSLLGVFLLLFFPQSVNMRFQLCRNIKFNYCILDEGHVIKNGKTKLSKAVKQLAANFRVILSGTPIQVSWAGLCAVHVSTCVTDCFLPQNNVLELWSLFDFLMPGFLGTERQFAARYGKPILASRDAKSSSREQEAGVWAHSAFIF